MKLIVGLGNPGSKYENTRHNVGWQVVDAIASTSSKSQIANYKQNSKSKFQFNKQFNAEVWQTDGVIFAKPHTFMNESGFSVRALTTYYKLPTTNLYVVHDDLDIKFGEYKIQKGKGPKLHGGINSIERELGTDDFWRVRIGVENRTKRMPNDKLPMLNEETETKIPGDAYVLMDFLEEEKKILDEVILQVVEELL